HLSLSLHAPERLPVHAGPLDVVARAAVHVRDLLGAELAHDLAHADDQAVVGDLAALGDDGARADQAVAAYPGAVEHDGLHADQRTRAHGTAVQHGLVAHGDELRQRHRDALVHVQHAALLDVGFRADLDGRVVAPYAGARP